MNDFFVYILKCNDNSYYVGHTDNLEHRIAEHQSGITRSYTSRRLPVKLVYSTVCDSREQAFSMEHQIKGWSRKKKEALIEGNLELLIEYAKCRNK